MDKQDRIVDINPAAKTIIGGEASEIIGRPAAQVFANRPCLVKTYTDETGTNIKISAGEGQDKRYYDLASSPLYNRKGNLSGRLLILRNITELEKTVQELEASRHRHRYAAGPD